MVTTQKVNVATRAAALCRVVMALFILGPSQATGASAASFDCGRATSRVEKLVCSSAELSRLDSELVLVYEAALGLEGKRSETVAGQRKWLVEERSKCYITSCLVNAYKTRIFSLRDLNSSPAACTLREQKLVGHWLRIEGGHFEEFYTSSSSEGQEFVSLLHGGPELLGTWKLNDCVVQIKADKSDVRDFNYRILGFENNVLYLKDIDRGGTASYRKVERGR